MKLKIVVVFFLFAVSSSAWAINNNTFSSITRFNSWSSVNDIYLEEEHACSGPDKKLYKLPKTDNQQFSLLLAAFSGNFRVKLSYECASSGYPEIHAVRVEK